MIQGIGCQECDNCVHLLVDDIELLQRNVTSMTRELHNISVGVLAMRRLDEINATVIELRPRVDRLTSAPTDLTSLEPLKHDLASVQRLADDVSIKSDRLLRESEVVSSDATDVRARAEGLYDEVIRMAVDAANNAIDYAKRVLDDIRNTIGLTNVEELLRDAERMLNEIRRRDFSQKTLEADEELARAMEALERARVLLNKAIEQSNRTRIYIERLTGIRRLLNDLKNNSDHSLANSNTATEMNERNQRVMQNIVDIVLIIKTTETEIHRCVDDSRRLIEEAKRFLDDARRAYEDINRELSRLDVATERVRTFVVKLTEENIVLRPLVDNATEHARKLQQQADNLDSLIADTKRSAEAALNASSSYQSIVDAINKAWNASKEAIAAAEEAISKSTGHADEAQRSRERSENLRDEAEEVTAILEDDLKPRLLSANQSIVVVNEIIREVRSSVTDIVLGLDMLPEDGYGNEAREASSVATGAQEKAGGAERKVQVIVDQLPEDQRKVNQIPRDIEAARKDIRDASHEVNKVIDLVPTAVSLLDRLRIQADRIRQIGVDLSANITALRNKVQIARDQANVIRVGVSFDSQSQLRVRAPKNFQAAGSYSKVSLYFRTNDQNGLIAYIGPDAGINIASYMALEVIDGRVQFKFDLGSGPVSIRSQKVVSDGVWHEVIAERTGKQGKLTVRTQDEENDVQTNTSPGTFAVLELNYNTKFFVGGIVDSAVNALKPSILTNTRWNGCMEDIKFDGVVVGPWNFEEAYFIKGCRDRDQLLEAPPVGFEFGGSGYMIVARGGFRPVTQSSIRFSFRSFASDGLMFLMGQPKKDFLSIELRDGKVLFQYDLGSGSANLQSTATYNDGEWHTVYVNRMNNDGILKIDGSSAASGRSPGSMKTLEVANETYFGGFKGQHTYPSVTQKPFKGCIKDVQFQTNTKDLNDNIEFKDVLPGCSEVIRSVSFRHDGSSSSSSSGYIAVSSSSLLGAEQQLRQTSLMFRSLEKDGLIMYAADDIRPTQPNATQQHTAFSVSLVGGKIVVMTTIEGKRTVLESAKDTYNEGRWHYLTITRDGRTLYLGIDNDEVLQTRLEGRLAKFVITSPIYFAGVPSDYAIILENVGTRTRLIGCISDVMINDIPVNFASTRNMSNAVLAACHIADPTPSPPSPPPRPILPTVVIPTGIPPVQCKLPLDPVIQRDVPVSDGIRFGIQPDSRYEYTSLPDPFSSESEFSVDFKTTSANGTIFYTSHSKFPDFIGLYLKNGHLGYAYNCGTGIARVLSDEVYNDGEWHTAVFTRVATEGTLDIDEGVESLTLDSPGRSSSIELTPPFFLGGLPVELPATVATNLDGVTTRFVGCLRSLKQSGKDVGAPSYDVGTEPCSQNVEPGTFFYTNGGHLVLSESFSVPLDITISLEIRPRTLSGVLLSVYSHGSGPPGGDFLVLQLVNGEVMFAMDNGHGEVKTLYTPPSKNELCDGEWHRIRATKAKNVVMLEVDGVSAAPGLGTAGVAHTNTNDPLYIGGVPEFHRGIHTRDQFVGCMRNVQIASETVNLSNARAVGHVNLAACPTT
jgi:laminin alpha 3/5